MPENEPQETPTVSTTPPRRRWWPWVVCLLAALFVLVSIAVPSGGCGVVGRTIRVCVSEESGGAIPGATVSLIQRHDEELLETLPAAEQAEMLRRNKRVSTTDEYGEARLSGRFGAGDMAALFGGEFRIEGMLKISHPNYRPSEELLQNRLSELSFPLRTREVEVRVVLIPNRT